MGFIKKVLRKSSNLYIYLVGSKIASSELDRVTKNSGNDVDQLIEVAFDFKFNHNFPKPWSLRIKPLQVKSEITALCKLVKELNPKIVVEIGTATGGTMFLFAHVAEPKRIVSIDLPGGSFGGGYPTWKIPFYKSLAKKNTINLIRADSHDKTTLEKTGDLLHGQKIDFLFIDGDHTYEGVKQDFSIYAPLVRKGGIVSFHDIVSHDPESGCEVDKFWNEIKQSYRYTEIIENREQKWAGIGVLNI